MKTNALMLNFCLALAVLSVARANAADTSKEPAAAGSGTPKIRFDQTVYDFGTTCRVEQVKGKFAFANVGDGVLKLEKPATSCGCTAAAAMPEVLQPGEKGEIAFTLHLGRMRAQMQKEITVVCNDPKTPRTILTVKADYTPLFEAIPGSVNVNIYKGSSTNVTARVTRTDGQPFNITRIKPSQDWIAAKAEPEPASTNQSVRITATLNPTGNPRYFSEMVQVYVDGLEQPAFYLAVHGRLIGDLTLTPESVYWPIVDLEKTPGSRRIVVQSHVTDKPFEIKNASSSLAGVTIETKVQPDGRSGEILAKLTSIPSNTTNGVIRFETNIPSQPVVEVPFVLIVAKRAQ